MSKPKIYTTTLRGYWKLPHLMYKDGVEEVELATLWVPPDEFYEKLGKALGIKFVDSVPVEEE